MASFYRHSFISFAGFMIIIAFFPTLQYLPQLTSSTIFPVVDNKRYYNLRKFNYHLPNI